MKIEDSLYGHYYDLRGLGLADEVNNDLKVPQEKWYNLVMNGKIKEFDDFLLSYEDLRSLKVYQYIVEFQGFLKTFSDDYAKLFCTIEKYEYLVKAVKIVNMQLENINDKISYHKCKSLLMGYKEYFTLLEQWSDLVNFDYKGEKLAAIENLSDCEPLKRLIDEINYYTSIRSNPIKEQIKDTHILVKECYKYIRKNNVRGEALEEFKEYLSFSTNYLNVILFLMNKNEKIKNKNNQSDLRRY